MGGRGSGSGRGGRSAAGGGGGGASKSNEVLTDRNELINMYNSFTNSSMPLEDKVRATNSTLERIKELETQAKGHLEKAYKYQDDYEKYSELANQNKALAKRFASENKPPKAEYYEKHAKNYQKQAKLVKKKLDANNAEALKRGELKQSSIPKQYQYKGEKGTRKVFKSPQAAKERWASVKKGLVSTALADQPTIVQSPKGGYSVIPHKLLKLNKLKEISPYQIKNIE